MASLPMRSISFAPQLNSISQKLAVVGPLSGTKLADQTINGRVDYSIQVQSLGFAAAKPGAPPVERRIVHVDLGNSEFGPGSPMLDQNDLRGFYVEWIEYQVWLQAFGTAADPTKPLDNWSIFRESPDTSNLTGSISNSISWGFNASAGAFGDMPTVGVGGNIGISSSHSHTLTDFTFFSTSTAKVLNHSVRLTMCQDGTAYANSSSLVDPWQSPFVGIRLRELPAMAKSNCPLIGQAIWMNENEAGLVPKLTVNLAVTPHWCLVEGKFDGMLHRQASGLGGTYHYRTDIDFGVLS